MYTVTYREYVNDYNNREMKKSFYNLNDISDWLYDHAQRDRDVYFTNPLNQRNGSTPVIQSIGYKTILMVHQIDSNNGIEFSDGRHTNGISHISETVAKWLVEKRTTKRSFNFAK